MFTRLFATVLLVGAILVFGVVSPLQAVGPANNINTNIFQQTFGRDQGGTSGNTIVSTTITKVVNYLLFVAGVVAIFYLLMSSFNYITAGGDEEKAKKARLTILYAILGIMVIVAAYAIIYASLDLATIISR